MGEILDYAKEIQFNALILSKIDIAMGLAELAINNNYHLPQINNESMIILKNARHPVIETILPFGEDFIPNDVCLDRKKNQIAIITGPNGRQKYIS